MLVDIMDLVSKVIWIVVCFQLEMVNSTFQTLEVTKVKINNNLNKTMAVAIMEHNKFMVQTK